jgi:hypothetical protein
MTHTHTGARLVMLFAVLCFPLSTIADDEGSDAGVDLPAPVDDTPVATALGQLSLCGTEASSVDLPAVLAEISADDLVTAIADGSVGRARLAHAIDAVAEIGSGDDLEYLRSISDDASWMYIGDAAVAETSAEALVAKQAHIAAEIRAHVVSAWNRRGDLPSEVLLEMVWDDDPLPAGRAIALALASEDPDVASEGSLACEMNEAAVSVEDICETVG